MRTEGAVSALASGPRHIASISAASAPKKRTQDWFGFIAFPRSGSKRRIGRKSRIHDRKRLAVCDKAYAGDAEIVSKLAGGNFHRTGRRSGPWRGLRKRC